MLPILSGNLKELPASQALRRLGFYYENQLSMGISPGLLEEHFGSISGDVSNQVDSLRAHGLGLAGQHGEEISAVAVTAVSTEVVFWGETNQVAYLPRKCPIVENLVLIDFFIGSLVIDTDDDDVLYSEAHFWYEFRRLGETATSHFMNVNSTNLILPGIIERLN